MTGADSGRTSMRAEAEIELRREAAMPTETANSDLRFGLFEADDTVAALPLALLLQKIDALEALEDVAFNDEAGNALEAFVL